MAIDKQIVKDFVSESKNLIHLMLSLLEKTENDFGSVKKLANYSGIVERVKNRAGSLVLMVSRDDALNLIADYADLCKVVSLKASEISKNQELFKVCVAFLLDATETLDFLLDHLDETKDELKKHFSRTFIERLQWISHQLSHDEKERLGQDGEGRLGQSDIDALMSKLGL